MLVTPAKDGSSSAPAVERVVWRLRASGSLTLVIRRVSWGRGNSRVPSDVGKYNLLSSHRTVSSAARGVTVANSKCTTESMEEAASAALGRMR